MPKIAELINLHNTKSIHLGALMELYMSDRVPLGPIPQHPEVHVSDGFELDPDKILTAPHRTVKYQLQEELAKKAGPDQLAVQKLKKAMIDAEANNKASMPLIQRKQDAWGPDAHLLPTTYGAFPQSLMTSGAALQKTDDAGPAFDISRLSDSERQLKLGQARADIVKLQGAYDLLPQNKKRRCCPGRLGATARCSRTMWRQTN